MGPVPFIFRTLENVKAVHKGRNQISVHLKIKITVLVRSVVLQLP